MNEFELYRIYFDTVLGARSICLFYFILDCSFILNRVNFTVGDSRLGETPIHTKHTNIETYL